MGVHAHRLIAYLIADALHDESIHHSNGQILNGTNAKLQLSLGIHRASTASMSRCCDEPSDDTSYSAEVEADANGDEDGLAGGPVDVSDRIVGAVDGNLPDGALSMRASHIIVEPEIGMIELEVRGSPSNNLCTIYLHGVLLCLAATREGASSYPTAV